MHFLVIILFALAIVMFLQINKASRDKNSFFGGSTQSRYKAQILRRADRARAKGFWARWED